MIQKIFQFVVTNFPDSLSFKNQIFDPEEGKNPATLLGRSTDFPSFFLDICFDLFFPEYLPDSLKFKLLDFLS